MKKQISTYYSDLIEAPSIVLSYEAHILEKLMKLIKAKRLEKERFIIDLCNPDYPYPAGVEPYDYWKNNQQQDFNEYDRLESICQLELKHRTKHLLKKPIIHNSYHLRDWMKEPEKFKKLWKIIENEPGFNSRKKKYYSSLMFHLNEKGYLNKSNATDRINIAAKMFKIDCTGQISNHSKDGKEYLFQSIPRTEDLI